jgi:hypothetical protein
MSRRHRSTARRKPSKDVMAATAIARWNEQLCPDGYDKTMTHLRPGIFLIDKPICGTGVMHHHETWRIKKYETVLTIADVSMEGRVPLPDFALRVKRGEVVASGVIRPIRENPVYAAMYKSAAPSLTEPDDMFPEDWLTIVYGNHDWMYETDTGKIPSKICLLWDTLIDTIVATETERRNLCIK